VVNEAVKIGFPRRGTYGLLPLGENFNPGTKVGLV